MSGFHGLLRKGAFSGKYETVNLAATRFVKLGLVFYIFTGTHYAARHLFWPPWRRNTATMRSNFAFSATWTF